MTCLQALGQILEAAFNDKTAPEMNELMLAAKEQLPSTSLRCNRFCRGNPLFKRRDYVKFFGLTSIPPDASNAFKGPLNFVYEIVPAEATIKGRWPGEKPYKAPPIEETEANLLNAP